MGQKINPKIFRLGLYTNEWDSYYIEKNVEESSLLIHNDIKIREFISRILYLKGFILHSCKLRYMSESISISIYYYKIISLSSDIESEEGLKNLVTSIEFFLRDKEVINLTCCNVFIKFRDINKYIISKVDLKMDYLNKLFRRNLKDVLFEDLLKVVVVSFLIKDSSRFFIDFLVLKLKIIKSQNKVLVYLKLILIEFLKKKFFNVLGVKLIIKGRFNKSQRSRKKDIILGSIPLHTLKSNIDYAYSTVYTVVGTFGIKLWICRV